MKTNLYVPILIILFTFLAAPAFGQLIHERLLNEGELTFEEIVEQSEKHFDKIGRVKGVGYKQFQRWKYWAKRNMDENGKVRSDVEALKSYNKFANAKGQSNRSINGSYTELGPLATINTSTWSSALGRVSSIGLDPNDDAHIIVGSPTGGIWKTTDYANTWTPLFDDQLLMDVYALEISHANPDHYWVGLNGGILRSTDGGIVWNSVSGISNSLINTIEMHPDDANVVFATNQSNGNVYRSTDGGQSFTTVMDHFSSMYDLEFHPTNANIIYTSGNGVAYKSVDGGASFSQITTGPWTGSSSNTMMMAVTPEEPTNLYVLEETGGGLNGVYFSDDEGASWTTLTDNACNCNNMLGYNQNSGGGQAPRDMDIIVSPVDPDIIHIAGVETWRTTDMGQNWTKTTAWNNPGGSNFIHADIDLLIYDNERIIAGTDGGIYLSTDEATSWTDLTFGLGIRQFYRIGASETEVDRVSGGSQDNGTGVLKTGDWYDWLGADGMETFIDWSDEDVIYGTSQNGQIYKSINGGNNTTFISQAGGQNGNWVTPFEQDPVDPNTIYTGKYEIWKSTNGGSSWSEISNFGLVSRNDELKIAPGNNQYIYASYGNELRTSTDGGANWSVSTVPGSSINYITVHPTDHERLSIVISGSSQKILESLDAGANWTDITGNLPSNVSMECATYDEVDGGPLYIGGNPGIYSIDDIASGVWTDESNNMPKVRVAELEIRNQILYVATYGRGLWKFEFECDGSNVGLSCNDLDICTENDVYDENCNCVGTFADADNDGVCDALDVCPGGDDNIDGDNDGIPDFCDGCAEDCPDADCDSVCDEDDICPDGDDTRDMDGDGIPDYCDPCDEQIGMPCEDIDLCTVNDVYDADCNCVGTLTDSDNDGVCDTFDTCPGFDDNQDSDGDGIPDGCDNCPFSDENPVLTLDIELDNYSYETTWEIKDASGNTVAENTGSYSGMNNQMVSESICIETDVCYDFIIYDSYGDGICCGYGLGSYTLKDYNDVVLVSGGEFGSSETTNFCISGCGADVDEDGYCLGEDPDDNDPCVPDDSLCADPCDVYDENDGESGWGIWNDGGADAALTNNASLANSGNYSFLIKDNTSTSVITTDDLDLSAVSALEIDFNFLAVGFDNTSQDFWLQISTDGGATYSTLKDWAFGINFTNNVREFETVSISGPFTANTKLRMRCDATGNNDKIYIDDLNINSCSESTGTCDDGIQNGAETGVDCGGPDCMACEPCEPIDENDLEFGLGIWNDGGADAAYVNNAAFANSGTYSAMIKDNTSTSVLTTDDINLANDMEVVIAFNFITTGFNNANQDFWLQVSTDGGGTYTTVEDWVYTVDFTNNTRVFEERTIAGPFTPSTRFRFRCDASGNNDKVYIDDIFMSACEGMPGQPVVFDTETRSNDVDQLDFAIRPNPVSASNVLYIDVVSETKAVNVQVFDLYGRIVLDQMVSNESYSNHKLSTDALSEGTYIMRVANSDLYRSKKFVVIK